MEVLAGKGQPHKTAPVSRGMVGTLGAHKESVKKGSAVTQNLWRTKWQRQLEFFSSLH